MFFQENIDLQKLHTFGLTSSAKFFFELDNNTNLPTLVKEINLHSLPFLVLGGGSNLIFTKDFEGILIKNSLRGIQILKETEDFVQVKVAAGENWADFVQYCVEKNWGGGIENLSLIPGTVGAAPIQNIGAYGVELVDIFESLEAINLTNGEIRSYTKAESEFGYRTSLYKTKLIGKIIILSVTFRLSKNAQANLSYRSLKNWFENKNISSPSIREVSKAVCEIRESKLPNPKIIGNAGSFFKNPIISSEKHTKLLEKFPDLVSFPLKNGDFKLAAGWLIQATGWKGKSHGGAAVHDKQALVLVNKNNAKPKDLLELIELVTNSVEEKFGVKLEREVNLV